MSSKPQTSFHVRFTVPAVGEQIVTTPDHTDGGIVLVGASTSMPGWLDLAVAVLVVDLRIGLANPGASVTNSVTSIVSAYREIVAQVLDRHETQLVWIQIDSMGNVDQFYLDGAGSLRNTVTWGALPGGCVRRAQHGGVSAGISDRGQPPARPHRSDDWLRPAGHGSHTWCTARPAQHPKPANNDPRSCRIHQEPDVIDALAQALGRSRSVLGKAPPDKQVAAAAALAAITDLAGRAGRVQRCARVLSEQMRPVTGEVLCLRQARPLQRHPRSRHP